jgi:release factor glutamine methyltransferase
VIFPLSQWYLSKERTFKYKDISIKVLPGVFHPGFFFSTKNLLKFLEEEELLNKSLLELGAGTGLISVFSYKKGADVVASDISLEAIRNIETNTKINNTKVEIIHSDMFEKIPLGIFDYIIINPPFYRKTPLSEKDFAWFAGDDLQYFEKLFKQIPQFINENSKVIVILSEDCEIEEIKSIAFDSPLPLELTEIKRIRTLWEWNYIFKIVFR